MRADLATSPISTALSAADSAPRRESFVAAAHNTDLASRETRSAQVLSEPVTQAGAHAVDLQAFPGETRAVLTGRARVEENGRARIGVVQSPPAVSVPLNR